MSLVHTFRTVKSCDELPLPSPPLRSSQGVGAEWHDKHRARNFVPPYLRPAVASAWMRDHAGLRSPPRCRNIEVRVRPYQY